MKCVPWTPNYACDDNWSTYDPDLQMRATDLAWASLRHLTAGRVGHCPARLRPCRQDCSGEVTYRPYIRDGQWYNAACGTHRDRCSCDHLWTVSMPGEVASVRQVVLGGEVLVEGVDYRLADRRDLIALAGRVWPTCQDMTQDFDGADAFTVDYVPGIAPGEAGLWAAGVLASEFAKACSGSKCRLPSSVTSVSRQGVTMEFSEGFFANGQTGIREVDAYVLSVNPNHLHTPSRVWSPDIGKGRFAPPGLWTRWY